LYPALGSADGQSLAWTACCKTAPLAAPRCLGRLPTVDDRRALHDNTRSKVKNILVWSGGGVLAAN